MKPINGYLLIEPLVHETFISSEKQTLDEIGTVIAIAPDTNPTMNGYSISVIKVGNKVYFDSFMAKKYPNPDKPDTFYWLVHKDEICAVDE